MTEDIKGENNTLTLSAENEPKCLSDTEPATYSVITWAINMTPNPTIDSIYNICGAAEELSHLDQAELKAAIAKVLEQRLPDTKARRRKR